MAEQYLNLALLKTQAQMAPSPPSDLVAVGRQLDNITIGWRDNSANEAGFKIERALGAGSFTEIAITAADVVSYLDPNLDPATTYRYQVRAYNVINDSAYTSILTTATLNPPAPSSLNDYSSLQDEIDAYGIYGWSYTGGQLPTIPSQAYSVGTQDVHGNLEADDLWQNAIMYQRTGVQGYADLRQAWNVYYETNYLIDYPADLASFFGDHTFGWGLVDATLPPTPASRAAANSIASTLQAEWYNFSYSTKNGFNGMRGPGRILKLASALTATGTSNRRQWADDIWLALRTSPQYREVTIGGQVCGFWHELDAGTVTGPFPWAAGSTGMISAFSFGVLNEGLAAYYDLTGNTEVQDRLIKMARFSRAVMLDTVTQHTGHWILVDAFGNLNTYYHQGLSSGETLDPFYTCTQVNTLVRGYLLTGDVSLLDRASYHWERSSKATAGDTDFPFSTNRTPANEVGHFMNSQMLGGIYYLSDGELTYVSLLFKAVANLNPQLSTPNPPDSLVAAVVSSTRIDLTWHDASSNETEFRIERNDGPGFSGFVQIGTVGANVNTFLDQGLLAATTYRYKVCAANGNGPSVFTAVEEETTSAGGGGAPPSAPNTLTVTAINYNQINLTWVDTSGDESGFKIKRCSGTACTPTTIIATVGAGVQSYPDSSLAANTLYRYTVTAYNTAGDSSPTSTEEDTTPTTTDEWTVAPNSSLHTLMNAQAYIVVPGPDGGSDNINNVLISWSSAVYCERPNAEKWLVIKNGGHNSWFYNDVCGYHFNGAPAGWVKLRGSFLPYVSQFEWDGHIAVGMDPYPPNTLGTTNAHSIFTDGSPGNSHTYDQCGYSSLTDECWWYSGQHTNNQTPRSAPINQFSMANYTYRYGPSWFGLGMGQFAVTDTLPNGHILIDGTRLVDYNPDTLVAADLGTATQPEYVNYSTGRYVNGKMYVFGPQSNNTATHSLGTWCKVHEVGVPGEIIMNLTGSTIPLYAAPGVAWEPVISKFIIWGGHQDIYYLDPATQSVTGPSTVPLGAGGTDPGEPIHYALQNHTGTYKRFGRLAAGSYYLMNSIDEIHLLTLDLGGGPPATSINLDATSDSNPNGTSVSPLTISHSCSGSNRLGVVAIIGDNVTGADDLTTVTWGGSGCTLGRKATAGFSDSVGRFMYLYYILNPATGPQDIVISSTTDHTLYALAASYTGVKQTTQPEATAEGHSASPTASSLTTPITTATDKCWAIMIEHSIGFPSTPTAGTGATLRRTNSTYGNISIFDSGEIPIGTHNMTTSLSTSPSARGVNHLVVAFKPA